VPKGDDQHGRSSLLLLVLVLHLVAPFLLLLPALGALLDPPRTTTTTFGSDLEAPRWVPAASQVAVRPSWQPPLAIRAGRFSPVPEWVHRGEKRRGILDGAGARRSAVRWA